MDWITDQIAIGDCDDARRRDALRREGVAAILSLNGWPNQAHDDHGLAWRCVEMIDGAGNAVSKLHDALTTLAELLAVGPTLVHCMEGVSRSPLVVASHLADSGQRPFADCLAEVTTRRVGVRVNEGLIALRAEYEVSALRLALPGSSGSAPPP